MKFNSDTKTCAPKCRSKKHAQELIALITKTSDLQTLLSGLMQCWNCHKIHDEFGRYLLHMSVSCGRTEVSEWLIKHKKADLNLKTLENGWTPAHCASFYGQIDTLIALIKLGANLNKNDNDYLNPLEHLILDKWQTTCYKHDIHDDSDIYSWGSNVNYNLGNGHDMKKTNPEIVEFFKKSDTSIIQIVMSKFHTVFLSKNGEVFTVGFGMGGRLGHDDELILMSPKLVEQLKKVRCIQVAASRNNTYFLTNDAVYSCGTNEFKQLGQLGVTKSLSPKQVNLGKRLKGKTIKQIECSRFHCALLTNTNEVWTFGLNAGQLGHPNEMVENATVYNNSICYVSEPRLITSLNESDLNIDLIACSDGCTVALQLSKNILYVFNDYKCKRLYYIKETKSPFRKIRVHGGKLDHFANSDLKWIEDLNDPVLIIGLTESNFLYVWREQDPCWRNICWNTNKKLLISDFDLNIHGLILCTIQGACYKAEFINQKHKSAKIQTPTSTNNCENSLKLNSPSNTNLFNDKTISENKTETLDLSQMPLLNRCFHVVCDKKARNFFSLQYHPNTNMRNYPILTESIFSNEMDSFLNENVSYSKETSFSYYNSLQLGSSCHDIELKFREKIFSLNKFILLSRSPKFFLKINLLKSEPVIDMDQYLAPKFSLQLFEILIKYIYTAHCSVEYLNGQIKNLKLNSEESFIKFLNDMKELFAEKFGLSEIKASFDSNFKKLKELSVNTKMSEEKFEIFVKFTHLLLNEASLSCSSGRSFKKNFKFNRNSYADLYDCQINCNNVDVIKCHKCILIARSDYFRNMLMGSWVESKQFEIQLPIDIDLMQIFVDYLYTDEIQMNFIHLNKNASIKSKNEREIEILFNLYVLSDQLLVERLKNLCEFKLVNLVNLKNIIEIFEFSHEYQANQLKEFCMEFISCNLVTLIEAKQLENVSLELLKDFSVFYRSYFPIVGSRIITPYSEGVDPSKIELIPLEFLYDQKFIDGNIDEEKKKTLSASLSSTSITTDENKSPEKNENSNKNENDTDSNQMEISTSIEKNGNEEKWEKVKKRTRRKISEKDLNVQLIPMEVSKSTKQNSPSQLTELDLHKVKKSSPSNINSPSIIDTTVKANNIVLGTKIIEKLEVNEWPSLMDTANKEIDMLSIKKITIQNTSTKQKFKVQSKSRQENQVVNSIKTTSQTVVWGGIKPELNEKSSKFSLMDVMNEEMKNLNVKSSKPIESKKKIVIENSNDLEKIQPLKGWNLATTSNQIVQNPVKSIAQIIDMENRSKENYKKLKSRPLSSIQLEEKAIEDLKRYYEVENRTNVSIRIELIDEVDFKDCTPVWKTK